MKYLGFDVSSSVIGWSFIDIFDGKILTDHIEYGYIKPPKGNEIQSLYELKKELDIFKKYKRKKDLSISIEEFPFFMSGGNSTAKTITKLGIYTRITALSLFEIFKMEPIFYKVATIRATIKRLCDKKDIKKEDIPISIQDIIKNNTSSEWTFPVMLNKNNKIKAETLDIADSFAVNFTHAYKLGELK